MSGKLDGDLNKARTTTLSNTVLTDYIKKANRDKKVKRLNNITIDVYPNSMAYYKLYTPYMELINGAKNYQGVDLTILDKVLTNVKGYTEVITKENHNMLVLRFNNTTFKGNYRLSDILKMNLDVYAIKVGTIDKYKLDLNNEFANYLFGNKHTESSFAKDLLDRETNVILLDEFDKANKLFFSAFYQLFDEGIFIDKNYSVELKKFNYNLYIKL